MWEISYWTSTMEYDCFHYSETLLNSIMKNIYIIFFIKTIINTLQFLTWNYIILKIKHKITLSFLFHIIYVTYNLGFQGQPLFISYLKTQDRLSKEVLTCTLS